MAPPKPSQQGKFRPKKPQKKLTRPATATDRKGESTSLFSAPSVTTSADRGENSALKRNDSSFAGRGEKRRGRGSRGRGGRGDRVRTPIPQGTVFFTGGERKEASSTKGSVSNRTSISTGAIRNLKKRGGSSGEDVSNLRDTSSEEVVGQLDTAIGSSGITKKESILEKDYGDYNDEEGHSDQVGGSMNMNISAGCVYDSDSSDERLMRKSKNMSLISPLELPFTLKSKSSDVKPDLTTSNQINDSLRIDHDESDQLIPPFAGITKDKDISDESDSWLLVQLPTRLPPMQNDFSCDENGHNETDSLDKITTIDSTASSATDNLLNNTSEVAVPPVTTSYFDNGLDKNAPGKIGKIFVYKSGKTVLIMDGPDDKISMDVNEGLTCTFHQQAVAMDVNDGLYITLGDVDRSIVISPDLTGV